MFKIQYLIPLYGFILWWVDIENARLKNCVPPNLFWSSSLTFAFICYHIAWIIIPLNMFIR